MCKLTSSGLADKQTEKIQRNQAPKTIYGKAKKLFNNKLDYRLIATEVIK